MRIILFLFALFSALEGYSQNQPISSDSLETSSKPVIKESPFSTGFYPVGFFDIDLTYPIKINNYESFRFGFGGITNDRLLENFKFGGHIAYGTKDKGLKWSLGGKARLAKKSNTWIDLYHIEDIIEIGDFSYLTDATVYSIFEPRLVNITQFYKHRTWKSAITHEFSDLIVSELRVANIKIEQIEDYRFLNDGVEFNDYGLAEATASVRFNSKQKEFMGENGLIQKTDIIPNISGQITQGLRGIGDGDFNYTKLGLKLEYDINRPNLSKTSFLLDTNVAFGDVPLTHLFHAYPNSPTKETILQRFSVAGIQSFETMFFGEFFSTELATLHLKHYFRPFKISERIQPELVIISRHALGNFQNPENHLLVSFNTLDKLYNEFGFELNKLIFGFGTSLAYRYGSYYLSDFEDNISFKFTFNLKI